MAAHLSMTASKLLLSSVPPHSKRYPHRSYFGAPVLAKPFLRGTPCISRAGLESADSIGELFSRAESLIYTLADAAVSSSDAVTSTTASTKQNSDWLSGITNYMELVLKILKDGLSTLHVPYAYGFAIILLTVLVKAATFPLTKKQIESGMAMRSLQPQIKAVQERYAGDQERIQLETARLYKLAGINPLAGCLPTLATIPVWIGLYRALSNVADEGLLTEGFFWIPSLAGPTTIAARQSGSSTSWLFPFVDGHPPLGWSDTLAYLVLPVLLVVSQYVSVQIMQSSQSNNDPSAKNTQAITQFLPLMIGYFALSVPSGLSLYWFTNNILSTAQQVFLQKLGGAKNPLKESGDASIKQVVESRAEKTVLGIDAAIKEKPTEKATPEGPRPGERFRLLKEQEERRKLEKEQQKKAAEGAVVSSSGQNDEEAHLISKSVNGATSSKHQNETIPENSSNGVAVNGESSSHKVSDAPTVPSDQLENGEGSSSSPVAEGTNDQQQN